MIQPSTFTKFPCVSSQEKTVCKTKKHPHFIMIYVFTNIFSFVFMSYYAIFSLKKMIGSSY
ncbi:MAG TPA: hypothetical protein DCS74_02970 [Veillonellaceae bacterium]|jgi:hypothetical protein|nr:hypothetical protein [Veillonellaceae bacterium]